MKTVDLTSQLGASFVRACEHSGSANRQLTKLCAKGNMSVAEIREVHLSLQNATAAMQDVLNQATKD